MPAACLNILGWVPKTTGKHLQYFIWSPSHLQLPDHTAVRTVANFFLLSYWCCNLFFVPILSYHRQEVKRSQRKIVTKSRASLPRAWSQIANKNLGKVWLRPLFHSCSSDAGNKELQMGNMHTLCKIELIYIHNKFSPKRERKSFQIGWKLNRHEDGGLACNTLNRKHLHLKGFLMRLVISILKDIWHSGLSIYSIKQRFILLLHFLLMISFLYIFVK